jgi:branched-chain amino acid transport system permease protein
LTAFHFGWEAPAALGAGLLAGLAFSLGIGLVVLRTTGVSFMIVTLMFAQACYLLTFQFGSYTRGDEGLTIAAGLRSFSALGQNIDLASANVRYNLALLLLALAILFTFKLVRAPIGRVLVAIRENEERTTMLGYDTFRYKLVAFVISGTIAASAGAAYALLFGYVGATFAGIQYSIYPLLWVLVGGAGTVAGPVLGTLLMFYLEDVSSGYTSAYRLVVGTALVLLILFFPKGILGTIRKRWLPWLP